LVNKGIAVSEVRHGVPLLREQLKFVESETETSCCMFAYYSKIVCKELIHLLVARLRFGRSISFVIVSLLLEPLVTAKSASSQKDDTQEAASLTEHDDCQETTKSGGTNEKYGPCSLFWVGRPAKILLDLLPSAISL